MASDCWFALQAHAAHVDRAFAVDDLSCQVAVGLDL